MRQRQKSIQALFKRNVEASHGRRTFEVHVRGNFSRLFADERSNMFRFGREKVFGRRIGHRRRGDEAASLDWRDWRRAADCSYTHGPLAFRPHGIIKFGRAMPRTPGCQSQVLALARRLHSSPSLNAVVWLRATKNSSSLPTTASLNNAVRPPDRPPGRKLRSRRLA